MNTKSGGIDWNFSNIVSGGGDSNVELSELVTGTDEELRPAFTWQTLLQFIADFHVYGSEPGARSSNQNLQLTDAISSKHINTGTAAHCYYEIQKCSS